MFSERRCGSSRPREMRAAENRKLILRTTFLGVLNFYAQFGVPSAPFRTDPALSSMWTSSVEKTSPRKSLSNSFFVSSFSPLLPSSFGGGRGVSLTTSLLRHADAAARAERAYVRTATLESFSLPNSTAKKTTLFFYVQWKPAMEFPTFAELPHVRAGQLLPAKEEEQPVAPRNVDAYLKQKVLGFFLEIYEA